MTLTAARSEAGGGGAPAQYRVQDETPSVTSILQACNFGSSLRLRQDAAGGPSTVTLTIRPPNRETAS